MNKGKFTYSHRACVFKKSYGPVRVTIILEEVVSSQAKERIAALHTLHTLQDEIANFLYDSELEKIFKQQE